MGHALVIPNTDFSSVSSKQVNFKSKQSFEQILSTFISVSKYTPTNEETSALRHLTDNLISQNIWDKIDALYLLLGNTFNSCRYNWKNPNTFIANTSNEEMFLLTAEHRIADTSKALYIDNFDDFNADNFHSLEFFEIGRQSIIMFPLSVTGYLLKNVPSLFFVKEQYVFNYRDNGLENTYKIDCSEYYNIGTDRIISGMFNINKNNNIIKYCSCEFNNILESYTMPNWSGSITTPFYLNSYHETDNTTYGMARIMGFGKSLTDSQMTTYMQLLNTYISETSNIYNS